MKKKIFRCIFSRTTKQDQTELKKKLCQVEVILNSGHLTTVIKDVYFFYLETKSASILKFIGI